LDDELQDKRYLCPICDEQYLINEIYLLDNCNHKYCRQCLEMMLQLKIKEGQTQNIRCPNPSCNSQIDYTQIKQLLSGNKEIFAKYEEFNLKQALESMQDLRWCPRPGCGNAMIGNEALPMMVCGSESCKFAFCFKCKEEWHADFSCEQYQQWKLENSEADKRYAEWVKLHAKECPKCHSQIEKNGGCNHMTCGKCRHEFCWLCSIDYTSSPFSESSCPQYS